ncbi:MAG: hypothetical protein ACHREM_04895, partial [Polyangiales bacterium]
CLLLALVVGVVIYARKLQAQTPPAASAIAPSMKGARAMAAPSGSTATSASAPMVLGVTMAAASAAPASSGSSASPAPSASASSTYEEPEDYATVGPNGGVPTHPDGPFRSPFAHPRWGTACNVRVGILLSSVRDYDIQKGTFESDFYLSLTSDKPMPPVEIVFANGKQDYKDVVADKPTFKLYRFVGTFSSPPDLRKYPFDTEDLTLEIEDHNNGIDQVRLLADKAHTNLGVGFHVTGWDVAGLGAKAIDYYYPDRFDDDDLYYSRYKCTLTLRRFGTSAAFTVFVPALVIALISLSGMWLPKEKLEVRSNTGAPMLAAAVLFHFALMQELPATPYLTRADKVMMAVYASLLLNIFSTWLWFVFDEKYEHRIFILAKRFVPVLTMTFMALGSFA